VPDAGVECDPGLGVLAGLQEQLYECMESRPDALWELALAVASLQAPVRSIAEVMLQPGVQRGWGSLYQALEDGRVNQEGIGRVAAGMLAEGGPLLFAVDASKISRPDARVCRDVGMQYDAKRVGSAVPGWSMLACVQVGLDGLSGRRGSWVLPVDTARVATASSDNDEAATVMRRVAATVVAGGDDRSAVFVFDCGFCPIFLTQQRPAGAQVLVRLRSDRVFFGRPPQRIPGALGRPRLHGDRFALDQPATWGPADAQHTAAGCDGSLVDTRAWHHRHPQAKQRRKWEGTAPVEGTLIRREHTYRDGRAQVWWLWWSGPADLFDLAVLAEVYSHRFTIEHWFRFLKQDMFWTGHRSIDPDQIVRWTWVLICAYLLLVAARAATAAHRLPWQQPLPVERLTPRRVQRGFLALRARLPRLAKPPKPSHPGTGRPAGSTNQHQRPRHPVIKKGRPDNTGHRKGQSPTARKKTKTPQA
jgi:Transposase DDE domain